MTAYMGGQETDPSAAIARAADLLAQSKNPVIAGLATDMDGAREALRLAIQIGAVVDHWASEGPLRIARMMRETGTMFTTPGEARNRTDLTIIVGDAPLTRDPGAVEAALADGLPRPGENSREAVLVCEKRPALRGGFDKSRVSTLAGAPLDTMLPALCAAAHGHKWAAGDLDRKLAKNIAAVAERLCAAHFSLFVYSPDELDLGLMQVVTDTVKHLNHERRSQTLPVGDRDNAYGVNQLCAWTCGLPLRTRLGGAEPEHDPVNFVGRVMIEQGQADASLWIASFPGEGTDIPRRTSIALAPAGIASRAEVTIEVGTPGEDYAAELYDARIGAVAHVEARNVARPLPRVGDVLRNISAAMAQRMAA